MTTPLSSARPSSVQKKNSKRRTHFFLVALACLALLGVALASASSANSPGDTGRVSPMLGRAAGVHAVAGATATAPAVVPVAAAHDIPPDPSAVTLNVERRRHTATEIAGGKVVVIGGDNAGGPVAAAEVFDAATRTFALSGSLGTARTEHAATLLTDGRVLVTGGRGASGVLSSTEIFDPAAGVLTAGPPLASARAGHTATALADGRIVIAGGDSGGTIEVFDPRTQAFASANATLSAARSFHSAALLSDGRVLFVGGFAADGTTPVRTGEIFDPASSRVSAANNSTQGDLWRPVLRVLPDGKVQVIAADMDASLQVFDPREGLFNAYAFVIDTGLSPSELSVTQTRVALFRHPRPGEANVGEHFDRQEYTVTEIESAGLSLVAGGRRHNGQAVGSGLVAGTSGRTVTTEKTHYGPGEPVTISGAGWTPGETVSILLREMPETHPAKIITAVADAGGNFINAEFEPDEHDRGVTFTISAREAGGWAAQTSFTDEESTTTQIFASQNPSQFGNSVTFTVQVRDTSGGLVTQGTVNFRITSLGLNVNLNPTGSVYTYTLSGLPVGTHFVEATFNPALQQSCFIHQHCSSCGFFSTCCTPHQHCSTFYNYFSSSGSMFQTVNPANTPPVAGNDAYSVTAGNTLTVAAPGVLANDTDAEGNLLTATLASGPLSGSLTLNANGSFTYTPFAAFTGTDSFTYRASDGAALSGPATVQITVAAPACVPLSQSGGWSLRASLTQPPQARFALAAADLNGTLFALGGIPSGCNAVNMVEVYDPATNTWTPRAPMPTARYHLAAAPLNGKLYATGGGNFCGTEYNTVEVYDPATNSWATRAPLPTPRIYHGLAAVGGKLYAMGGSRPSTGQIFKDVYEYDPSSNTWTAKANMPVERTTFGVAVLNGRIYAVGGYSNSGNLTSVDVYDPATNTWSSSAPLPEVRTYPGVATLNGKLYAYGGAGLAGVMDSVRVYDPAANTWGAGVPMLTPRFTFGAAASGGRLYAVGGESVAAVKLASVEAFTPPSGLVAFYPASGNANDVIGGNNGSLQNGAAFAAGKVGTAFRFDGVDDYVSVPGTHGGGAEASVVAWVRTDATTGDFQSVVSSTTTNEFVHLQLNSAGNVAVYTDAGFIPLPIIPQTPTGVWRHLALSIKSGDTRLYVDGSLAGTSPATFSSIVPTSSLRIGSGCCTGRHFAGLVDEVQLYNRALSESEVQSIYNAGSAGFCNTPPVAQNSSVTTAEDTPVNITLAATDPEGGSLTYTVVGQPLHGMLSGTGANRTYTPNANYHGPDSFTFSVSDGSATSNVATVSINVTPVNDAPTANGESYNTNEDTPLNVAAPGVLANDGDVDSSPLAAAVVDAPAHGTLTLNPDGSFTYTPAANYNGPDSFTYQAVDNLGAVSNVATVNITVAPVNDAPTASAGGPYTVDEGGTVAVSAAGADVENDALTYAWDLNNDGLFETPGQNPTFSAAGLNGPATRTIHVRVSDGALSTTASATVNISNVAPTVNAGPDTTATQGSPLNGSGSFTDPGADTWTATVDYGDGTGVQPLALNTANKTFGLAHNYANTGFYTVTVTLSDGVASAADTARVTVFSDTCTALPSGAVAWYPGENTGDDIVGGNDGALQNGATYAAGKVGRAFSLDGVNDFVNAGNAPALHVSAGDFTVDAWVYFNALSHPPGANTGGAPPGDMSIVDKMAATAIPNADGWRLLKQDDNHFWFGFGGGASNGIFPGSPITVTSTTTATTGTWFHVMAVKSNSEIAIYVNGVKEDSKPLAAFTDTHSTALLIGSNAREAAHLNGEVDEVEVFNRALSASEVQALYLAGRLGKCPPPTTTTAVQNAPATYGPADQSVTLSATVTPSSGTVNDGTVTFTVKTAGGATVGSPVTANVTNGTASAAFTLPGGTAVQTLNVTAAYVSAVPDFQPSTGAGTLAVGKATPTVNVTGGTFTYDGAGHEASATAADAGGSPVAGSFAVTYDPACGTYAPCGSNPTDSGSYNVTVNFQSADPNYGDAVGFGLIVINPAGATLSVTGGTFTYDGHAHPATATATGVGGVSLPVTIYYNGDAAQQPVDAGTYAVLAVLDHNINYEPAQATTTININRADSLVTVTAADATYDGQPHGGTASVTGVNLNQPLPVTYTGRNGTIYPASAIPPTNAGDYTASATFDGDSNHEGSSGSKDFRIAKAASAVTVNCPASQTYTGAGLEPCTATYSGAGGLSGTLTPTYTDNLNVGTATASASYAGDANHEGSSDSEQFQITPAASTTVVTFEAGPYVYRGSAFTATATVTGAGNLNAPVTVVYTGDCTNVTTTDGCTATATYGGDQNHNGSTDSKSITITKAVATIALGDLHQTYNGAPRVASATTNPAGLSGVTVTYNGSTTPPTGAGSYAVVASLNHQNYQADDATGTLVVGKAAPVIMATGNTCTYSGDPCTGSGTATGVDGANLGAVMLTYTPGGSAPVNAGSYTVVASIAETANHTAGASAPAAVQIDRALPTVNVTVPNAPITYDGDAHPATGFAYGVGGTGDVLTPAVTFTYNGGAAAPVNVSTYAVVASFAGNDNYLPAVNDSTSITITKAAAIINVQGYTGVYDGQPHGATGTATGVKGESLSGLDFGASFTNVPGGTANWTFTDATGNYNDASGTAAVVITQANATITVEGYTGVYDGQPHGAAGTARGVNNEDLTNLLDLGASFTDAPGGTAHWTFAGNTNYATAGGTAAIVIIRAAQTINWGDPAPIVYGTALSGAQLNATVSGVPGGSPAGALTYTPGAGALLGAGAHQPLTVNAAATTNYDAASKTVYIGVAKAVPVVNWVTPAAILYGTPLSAAQLNATAAHPADGGPRSGVSLAGTFAYTPAAGAVLPVGDNTLSVLFTPGDTANYTTATKTVTQRVNYNVCVLYDQNKAAKSGSTIPIKLQLCDASGANLSSSGIVVTAVGTRLVSPVAWGAVEDAGHANPDMNFRFTTFDPATTGYIFNLQTKGLATGIYQLGFYVGSDPTVYTVQFQIK